MQLKKDVGPLQRKICLIPSHKMESINHLSCKAIFFECLQNHLGLENHNALFFKKSLQPAPDHLSEEEFYFLISEIFLYKFHPI